MLKKSIVVVSLWAIAPLSTWAAVKGAALPYVETFSAESSLDGLRPDGERAGTVTYLSDDGFDGGYARIKPDGRNQNWVGFRNILFAQPYPVVQYHQLVRFGKKFGSSFTSAGENRSFKHVVINRRTEMAAGKASGDRGMIYFWHTGPGDGAIGACLSTECTYEGGDMRPVPNSSFPLSRYAGQWVWLRFNFDLKRHVAEVFVTTRDGKLKNKLISSHPLNKVDPDFDAWTRIDGIGLYVDRGAVAQEGNHFDIDQFAISATPLSPPEGFFIKNTQ